jgi:beta-glucosidase
MGLHAPGVSSAQAILAASHHQNLAQGLGYSALRASLPPGRRIGSTLNVQPCRPSEGREENDEAARTMDDAWNRLFLNPLFGKAYPERFSAILGELMKANDAEILAAPIDFLGINYYSRFYMRADPGAPFGIALGEGPPGIERTSLGWGIEPDGLEEALLMIQREYSNIETIVCEFGAFFQDPAPVNDIVEDPKRIDFIRRYLTAMGSAIRQGVNLKGALYWTVTDNWEWAQGFTPTFGLAQLDRLTLARIPKRSLLYLGDCAKQNKVL